MEYSWLVIPGLAIFAILLGVLNGRKPVRGEITSFPPDKPLPPLDPAPTPPVPEPTPEPPEPAPEPVPEPPKESNREILYRVAKDCLGRDMSPKDLAPDDLACAESINGVFREAFGADLVKNVVSTTVLYNAMLKDPRLKKIPHSEIQPGDISIAVTGQSTKGTLHGHVGIWGNYTVMSNNSATGKWAAHYSLEAWKNVFENKLGFPLHAFRVV